MPRLLGRRLVRREDLRDFHIGLVILRMSMLEIKKPSRLRTYGLVIKFERRLITD